MKRAIPSALAALALFAGAAPALAIPAPVRPADAPAASLPALYVRYFFEWKSEPAALKISELKVLNAGGAMRVLCGVYDLPGQASRPFLVLGDDRPTPSAAWEPGSFP